MCSQVAIVYNEPVSSRYDAIGEARAVLGILDAVTAVHQALLELGYDVLRIPLVPPLELAREKLKTLMVNLIFNLFEGFCGQPESEALVPEVVAELGIPYTGCPGEVLRLALDKAKTKALLTVAGINTPSFQLLSPQILTQFQLSYPCIVKPGGEDASHGLSEESVVTNYFSLVKQVTVVSQLFGGMALAEEFLEGREFNVSVLGNCNYTVLPVSEIIYALPPEMPRILTFAAKWQPESVYFKGTRVICPAQITVEEQEHIAGLAVTVFRLLGCRSYARVDIRLDKLGRLNVIEVNPNPDISPGSGAVLQAKAAGLNYTQFVEKIVRLALEGNNNAHSNTLDDSRRQTERNENLESYTRI